MPSRSKARRLSLRQAAALGALHGPAELLPISSSGHVALVPWLLDWEYDRLDAELRKSFEVALHAGTAAALLIALDKEIRGINLRLIALASLPPAAAGYAFERPIERRLGTPQSIAVGLLSGALAMILADRASQTRRHDEATTRDALWLGVAQAFALIPGVSRNGAILTVARVRGFARRDANRLSRQMALPVIAGATALKALRLQRRSLEAGTLAPFAAGAGAAFASTLGSSWIIRRDGSLLPYAAYRVVLAAMVLRRPQRDR